MTTAAAWPAPAKLNLFLHVIGRRGDGYHEMQTLFQIIDFGDEVTITVRDDGALRRVTELPGVAVEADLVMRAARLLKQRAGSVLGADIGVVKRLPMGGGLGGGSSDAATVLVALNRLWGLGWSREALARLGLELGADVPVFVAGRTAWGEGVGERLQPVDLAPSWFVVTTPPCAVPTAAIFGDPELTRNTPALKISRFFQPGGGVAVADLMAATRNDCEAVVRRRHPEVAEMLDALAAHGPARLTGTGASAFVVVASAAEALRVAATLPAAWRPTVARGLPRSPLEERLND